MIVCHSATPFKRRKRTRRTHDRQLTTMSIDLQVRTKLRNPFQHRSLDRDFREVRAGACDPFAKLLLVGFIRLTERIAISIETFTTLNDIDPVL